MKNIFYFLFILVFLSCKEKLQDKGGGLIETVYGETEYGQTFYGTMNDSIKIGIWNYFNSDGITVSEYYSNQGKVYKKQVFSFGSIIKTEFYDSNGVFFKSVVENLNSYLFTLGILREVSEPDADYGRAIYLQNCFICHPVNNGMEFIKSVNKSSEEIFSTVEKQQLSYSDNKILLYPADSSVHFVFGLFNKIDIESLILFFNSNEDIR